MFCIKCGNQVNDGAGFCPNCGNKIENSITNNVSSQSMANSAVVNTVATVNLKKKPKTWRVVLLAVVATIVAGFAGLISLGSKSTIDSTSTIQSEWDTDDYDGDYQYVIYVEASEKTVYELGDFRNYGVAYNVAVPGTRIDFEGFYGIRLDVTDNRISYSVYEHNDAISDTAKITLYQVKGDDYIKVKDLGNAKTDEMFVIDEKLSENVIYAVGAAFNIKDIDEPQEAFGYLYNDGGKISVCRLALDDAINIEKYIIAWNRLLADADPENYLSNNKITYPTSGNGLNVVHVKQWEDISDTLILHDDWSDEMKVFVFVDYLSKNVAYDNYRADEMNNRSRASIAEDYTKDEYFTLGNSVGVCWDYVNILTIMCRHHGIPCTSVDSDTHTVNAVWLNGQWTGIDITVTARWNCYSEDTDKDLWVQHDSATYAFYGTPNPTPEISFDFYSHDDSIWTREKGLGLK